MLDNGMSGKSMIFIYATMGYIYRQGGWKILDLRMRTGGKTSQGAAAPWWTQGEGGATPKVG